MKRRVLSLLLVASMAVSLVGCGSFDKSQYEDFALMTTADSDTDKDQTTTTTTGDSSGDVTDDTSSPDTTEPEQSSDSQTEPADTSDAPQASDTTTSTSGSDSVTVTTTTTTASNGQNTSTTTASSNGTSSGNTTTTTTKKPTSSTTTTTTKKPTSSTTTTKKPTSSTTTTTTKKTTTPTTTTTTRKTTTTTTTTAHKHSYTSKITKNATCVAAGEKTYTCSCGHSYTEGISATGHSYTSKVVSPTPDAQGYTLYTCSKCSSSYKDNYTAKITLSAPSGFAKSGTPITSAKFTWSKVSNADGYVIEMSTSSSFTSPKTYTISSASTLTYTVSSLSPATQYHFRIKSYKTIDGKKYYSSPSTSVFFYTQLAVPVIDKTMNNHQMVVNMGWSKVTGAGGYEVQQYKDSKWVTVADVGGSTTIVSIIKLSVGTIYKFRVRAYSSSKAAYSDYAYYDTATLPSFSTILPHTVGKTSVTIKWGAIDYVTGYEIYLRKSDADWGTTPTKTITNKSTSSWTASSLKSGTNYQYKMRSYIEVDGRKYYSPFSPVASFTTTK